MKLMPVSSGAGLPLAQPPGAPAYSGPGRAGHPHRRPARAGRTSALADPALERLGGLGRGQVLAITPAATLRCPARAVLVELLPACMADHMPIIRSRIRART
jgi:hypothetical protein